jgi:hypothetical protein
VKSSNLKPHMEQFQFPKHFILWCLLTAYQTIHTAQTPCNPDCRGPSQKQLQSQKEKLFMSNPIKLCECLYALYHVPKNLSASSTFLIAFSVGVTRSSLPPGRRQTALCTPGIRSRVGLAEFSDLLPYMTLNDEQA